MSAIATANAQQRRAADPRTSAFVTASAGSGKTKLLTDRLLRLLLAGTPPQKILCLTYTKAAAAEMKLRLNARLGDWVVSPAETLAAALRDLDIPPTDANLQRARKIFAEVLDLPGGMRIETIHAFCQSLLRRFPLEAALSPHFQLADDAQAAARLREARETYLAHGDHHDAITALAGETNEQDFAALTAALAAHENPIMRDEDPAAIAAMQHAALGTDEANADAGAIARAAVTWSREPRLANALRRIAIAGTPKGRTDASDALAWLQLDPEQRHRTWSNWVAAHLTKDGSPRKWGGYLGKALAAEADSLLDELATECARINAVHEAIRTARLATLNAHIAGLAAPILRAEAAAKTRAARLAYRDLIHHTELLLRDPGAAWILYKLDGGIDHLLLDEVQDTAPAQWDIAGAIAAEFFSGLGARDQPRSIFAVGDPKQSIFSFQGADLASFSHYRDKFAAQARAAGRPWLDGQLSVSFRSTTPVLALVDAVFSASAARDGVYDPGDTPRHLVSREGQAGRVTLWPLTEATTPEPAPDWAVPETYSGGQTAKTMLARQIATHIAARLAAAEQLPSRGRPITPGDFLILVRRRDALVAALTSALKAAGIPVAGLDRMVLTEQQAVSDLLALCESLLLPEDDLAFAQFLVSPLGGLSDDSLMQLALDRGRRRLFEALYARATERPDWQEAKEFFETLRAKTDFSSPFALLNEALGPLGGRARLLRRLGEDAAEPIDELLSEALTFVQTEPGALKLFLESLRRSGATIKREAESSGNQVRIMTVHGAKGLQAPIVILPDTTTLPKAAETLHWLPVPQQPRAFVPIFCPRKELRAEPVAAAAAAHAAAQAQEYNRLLYVALTRAEDEILVCGAVGKTKMPETAWYSNVRAGFLLLGAAPDEAGILTLTTPQTAPPDRPSRHLATAAVTLPAWAGAAPAWGATPPARETTRPERLAPSRAVDESAARAIAASPIGPAAATRQARAAAMEKGRAIHALLQHLPDAPPAARAAAARTYLARIPGLADQADAIIASVLAILTDPALTPLFAPGSRPETPFAGIIGDVEIGGLVDRLAITDAEILIADYKTDRTPPATPEAIPAPYLRQLAAYRAILSQIHPTLPITCLLIWTATATPMTVPPALLTRHAPA
jgi:ATP-dependent helicase/nuclease subunit A